MWGRVNNNNNKSVMLKIYAATTTRYVGSTLPLEVRALNCSNVSGMYAEYIHMFQYITPYIKHASF